MTIRPVREATPLHLHDVASDAVMLAGGGCAILLQLAHPAIGHGVAAHSDFVERPLDRLHGTLDYLYALAYGDQLEQEEVVRRVNHAHAPVRGETGHGIPSYSAFDPELQLWVAATMYYAAAEVYERVFGALDEASADAMYREYAELGTRLQMPPGLWPVDRSAFVVYWNTGLAALSTDATTRSVARMLLHPRHVPFWLRSIMPVIRFVTIGLLPAPVRELYGFSWTPGRQRAFDRVTQVTAVVYPRLPRRLRQWPRNHVLRRLRRSLPRTLVGTNTEKVA
ncbi:oxygenase MpaB family protein [Luethyella okanaganae]|uniref:Oxygenase MpaB family protein n=1 Tax=Luethyella okanaganae TaxID=69372 RepID=A0ABW1VDL4_9MICO